MGKYTEAELRALGSSPTAVYGWSPNGKTRLINGKKDWGPIDQPRTRQPRFPPRRIPILSPTNLPPVNFPVHNYSTRRNPNRPSPPLPPPPTLFSVFLCNLPPSITPDQIRTHFGVHGELQAVDLPPNKTKSGKFMAFLHFSSHRAADLTIKEFDGKLFRGNRLLVMESSRSPPPQSSYRTGNLGPILPLLTPFQPPQPSPPREPSNPPKSKSSTIPANSPSPTTSSNPECLGAPNPWAENFLQTCLLGIAHFDEDIQAIKADLALEEVFDLSIIDLGNRIFLISATESSFPERFGSNSISFLEKWFSFVPNCIQLIEDGGFYKWIQMEGIPISAWSEASITSLANSVGDLVHIHPQSLAGSHMQKAFALIHLKSPTQVNCTRSLNLDKCSYKVKISGIRSSKVPVASQWDEETSGLSGSQPSDHQTHSSPSSPPEKLEDGEIELSPIQSTSLSPAEHVSASVTESPAHPSRDTRALSSPHSTPITSGSPRDARSSPSLGQRRNAFKAPQAPTLDFRQALLKTKPTNPKPILEPSSSFTKPTPSNGKKKSDILRARSTPNLTTLILPSQATVPIPSQAINAELMEARNAWELCKRMGFKSKDPDSEVILQFQRILHPRPVLPLLQAPAPNLSS